MKFTKMHGIGNDYIYINGFKETVTSPEKLAIKISDRHFGVGGDGLILILPSAVADAKMRMFNADGSEAEMCGNGIRCVGKYLYDHHLVNKTEITVETLAGVKQLTLHVTSGRVAEVTVNMGQPVLSGFEIPVALDLPQVIAHPLTVNAHHYHFTAVSMGNPHCIIFVPEIEDAMVLEDGPLIEAHPLFPKKTNVEFVKVNHANDLTMRVWERGSGETMACGTGACATLVAAVLNNLCDTSATIHLLGGDLLLTWDRVNNHLLMTGPATEVFEGDWL